MIPKPERRAPRPRKRIARKVRVRKVKKTSRGKMGREADRLFSLIVRCRTVYCMAAHRFHAGNTQCAHIISRTYRSVRWDEDNAIPLCAGCHRFYTSRGVEWRGFVIEMFGRDLFESLERRALRPWDKDITGVVERLRDRAKELGIEGC